MAAKPGRGSKRTVAVGDLGLAHEARAGGRAGGRARAELHAGFAREGNLRAQGSHVGGDGGHGLSLWANVSSSDRRLARCVRATNLRARQGRRRLWRAHPGRASTRLAKESGVSGRILQLYTSGYSTVFQSQSFTEAEKLPRERLQQLALDFRPRTTLTRISSAGLGRARPNRGLSLHVSLFLVSRASSFFGLAQPTRAQFPGDDDGDGEPRHRGGSREARAHGDRPGEQPGHVPASKEVLPGAGAL